MKAVASIRVGDLGPVRRRLGPGCPAMPTDFMRLTPPDPAPSIEPQKSSAETADAGPEFITMGTVIFTCPPGGLAWSHSDEGARQSVSFPVAALESTLGVTQTPTVAVIWLEHAGIVASPHKTVPTAFTSGGAAAPGVVRNAASGSSLLERCESVRSRQRATCCRTTLMGRDQTGGSWWFAVLPIPIHDQISVET